MLFYSTASKKNSQAFLAEYSQTLCNLQKHLPLQNLPLTFAEKLCICFLQQKLPFAKIYRKQRKTTTAFCFAEKQNVRCPHKFHKARKLLLPVFEDLATENCLLQKFTANNGKLQRNFALRKGKLHAVCTKFTKQELAFTIFKRLPRKNDFAR